MEIKLNRALTIKDPMRIFSHCVVLIRRDGPAAGPHDPERRTEPCT